MVWNDRSRIELTASRAPPTRTEILWADINLSCQVLWLIWPFMSGAVADIDHSCQVLWLTWPITSGAVADMTSHVRYYDWYWPLMSGTLPDIDHSCQVLRLIKSCQKLCLILTPRVRYCTWYWPLIFPHWKTWDSEWWYNSDIEHINIYIPITT